jgi:hypothetical protein
MIMSVSGILVLAAPLEPVSRRKLHSRRYLLLRLVDITAHVAARKIDVDVIGQKTLLALDLGRPLNNRDLGERT